MLIRIVRKIKNTIVNKFVWQKKWHKVEKKFDVSGPRIIYAITPPPRLSNIGDQAQVVAIYKWMENNFPDHSIIELNKDEVTHLTHKFKTLINPEDKIILHSGGNMGDRGLWSERARRKMIKYFHGNTVLSLPQTIHFSDTPKGRRELNTSKAIYNAHPNLTVVARDHQSFALANKYFPNCSTDETPDFVLSYDWKIDIEAKTNGKVLFCLREDSESNISESEREKLLSLSPLPYDVFDTTISKEIDDEERKNVLDETLKMFSQYDLIITDRFHGLIFSVLCGKPTVVLPTVDHKLTSAFDWFDEVKFLKFAKGISEVKNMVEKVQSEESRYVPNWNEKYFNPLTKYFK